jgi:hypothetical protein
MSVRVAILSDGEAPRAWHAACLAALVRDGVSIVSVFLYRSTSMGAARIAGARADSQRYAPLPESCAQVPALDIEATERNGVLDANDAVARALAACGADAILHFGRAHLPAGLGRALRYGVWSFRFGRDGHDADRPVGFWELYDNEDVLEASLLRDGMRALKRGWFETTPYSLAATIDTVSFGVAEWPAQVCREIAAGLDVGTIDLKVDRYKADRYNSALRASRSAKADRSITAITRAVFAMRLTWRGVLARFGFLFRHEHWNVGVIARPIQSLAKGGVLCGVRWLPFPKTGRFAADPFGAEKDGAMSVVCEEFDYADKRGFLSAARIDGPPETDLWRPVLRLPFHLSYPFLVRRDRAIYCIPESSEAGEIAIYEAVDFPFAWKRSATLVAGFGGADATVFENNGRWWLFATPGSAPNRCLCVWYADDLFGPWRPHPRNPVKTDPRSARPEGTPFVSEGRLYRPAQDCAAAYGKRVAIMHVRVLTPTEFDEEAVAWVTPDCAGPCPDGIHTLSAVGSATLVDGKYYRFVPREFARVLAQYAGAAGRVLRAGAKGRQP